MKGGKVTPFKFNRLEIPGVVLVEPRLFGDARGFFMETYKQSDFEANGIPDKLVQGNYSHSQKGILRGLHYQKHPKAQGKLVMVIRGEILDVAVDVRKGSPTYGNHVQEVLSAENHRMLFVPVGFAHGFLALSDDTDVVYMVTGGEYAPEAEGGIRWDDPQLGIEWPLLKPIVSEKDAVLPFLKDIDHNFIYEKGGDK